MVNFTKDMSIEAILERMDQHSGAGSGGSNTAIMHAGACFIQFKLHQELMTEQKKANQALVEMQQKFQRGNLSRTGSLVVATWALVFVTIILCFIK